MVENVIKREEAIRIIKSIYTQYFSEEDVKKAFEHFPDDKEFDSKKIKEVVSILLHGKDENDLGIKVEER